MSCPEMLRGKVGGNLTTDKKRYPQCLKITNQVGGLVHQTCFIWFEMINEVAI